MAHIVILNRNSRIIISCECPCNKYHNTLEFQKFNMFKLLEEMVWVKSNLYSYKSGYGNDLLFNALYHGMYSTENMYIAYSICQ